MRKKVLDAAIKGLMQSAGCPKRELLIAFGDASFSHTSPGHAPSPQRRWVVERMRRVHQLDVLDIGEFNPSKLSRSQFLNILNSVNGRNPIGLGQITLPESLSERGLSAYGTQTSLRYAPLSPAAHRHGGSTANLSPLHVSRPGGRRTDLDLGLPADSVDAEHYRSLLGKARQEVDSWQAQGRLKPRGYDAQRDVQLSSGTEVYCTTSGGRIAARWKHENQDAFLLQAIPPAPGAGLAPRGALVVGVFDGHGPRGGEVARSVRDSVSKRLAGAGTEGRAGPDGSVGPRPAEVEAGAATAALAEGLRGAELDLAARGRDYSRSGTTAVVCMLEPGAVTAAWAGDSRAVLGVVDEHGGHAVRALTRDHKPELPGEMARIVRCGGRVMQVYYDANRTPIGPYRVCLPHTTSPGLAVSRALGDTLAASIGVSATPELSRERLTTAAGAGGYVPVPAAVAPSAASTRRHVLVVASDGLWQWVDSAAAVDIAAAAGSAKAAARALLDVARLRWAMQYGGAHVDDITVVVAFIPAE